MFEINMKKYAYMDSLKNHNGFSMVSMLITISIILLSIPFVSYLLNSLSYTTHYESLSVNQFYLFLRDELIQSSNIEVNSQSISYKLENGDVATFSQYKDLIRRQVENKGHEIYLRDIDKISFETVTHGVRTTIKTSQGVTYEKTLFLF